MRRNSAFSLVELLVVIAVISILAGLLLPTLENALAISRQMSCMSRQKQFHLGIEMYAQDFEWYPPANLNGGYTYNAPWLGKYYVFHELVSPYLAFPYSNMGFGQTVSTNIFLCPASGYTPQPNATAVVATGTAYFVAGRQIVANYMLSQYFGNNHCFDTATAYDHTYNHVLRPKKNPPNTTPPSKRMILGSNRGGMGGIPLFGYMAKYGNVVYPHLDMTNILFLDGHTASYPDLAAVYGDEMEFYSAAEQNFYE